MPTHSQIAADVALAEASAWLARLQGPARTPAAEAAFRNWLAADPAHAHAFARVTETWEMVPGAALLSAAPESRQVRRSRRVPMALAACVALAAVAAGLAWLLPRDPVYRTAVGQQQTVFLDDGTRIALNTDSKLVVAYDEAERRVQLERGEALFEVAKQPRRPFIVQAGDEQVRALGTTFVVRRDPDRLAVSLIEGRVEVSRLSSPLPRRRPATATVLSPGERIVLRPDAVQRLEHPKVEAMAAWRRGEALFDDVTLAEAAAELNRYGGPRVRVDDPALARLRVSGVFATHDPSEFTQTIAQLHGLSVKREGTELVLGR